MRQYHNQPIEAPLHKRLTEMWAVVEKESRGRVQVTITPQNNQMKDGDPDPLPMLMKGEIHFYTLAGNGLSGQVPAADVQATPYVFRETAKAFRAFDGELGDYLREECKTKGIYALPRACFDNGIHQVTTASRPVRTAADMQGLRIRVPGSQLYQDFFRTFGAVTAGMNINALHDALKSGRVEAQDDPFDVAELFRLYEVQKVHERDQSLVVRIQPARELENMAGASLRHSGGDRAECAKVRADAARRRRRDEQQAAGPIDQARNGVHRFQHRHFPRSAELLLRPLEKCDRIEGDELARVAGGQAEFLSDTGLRSPPGLG